MNCEFAGKVVVITGASSGIGEALAQEYARRGGKVAALARREARLHQLAQQYPSILPLCCDVNTPGCVEQCFQTVASKWGQIDVVIANAGFGVVGRFESLSVDDYRRQFETNFFAVVATAHAAIDYLKTTHGRLGIVGSVNGLVPIGGNSAYVASKFAVRGFARSIAYELSSLGISVTHIAPGFIRSQIRKIDNWGNLHPDHQDPIPDWLQMEAPLAARKIVRAIERRKRECIITFHGKLAVFLERHFQKLFPALISGLGVKSRARTT